MARIAQGGASAVGDGGDHGSEEPGGETPGGDQGQEKSIKNGLV